MPPGPAAPPPSPPPEPRGRAHPPGPAAAPGAVPTQRPASPGHPPPAGQDPAGSPSVTVPPPPRAKPRRLGHPVGAAPLYGGLAAFEGRGGGNKAGRKASVAGFGARDTDLGTATAPAPCPRRFYFRMEVPEKAKTAARKRLPGGGFCPGWRQQPGPWPCWVGAVLPPESTALRGDTTGQPPTVQPHHPRLHGDPIPASPLRQPGVQNWEPL